MVSDCLSLISLLRIIYDICVFTKWVDDMVNILIVMVDEARKGNRIDSSWIMQTYTNVGG